MVTDAGGTVKALHDFLPFGEEVPAGIGGRSSDYYPAGTLAINDTINQKFTGKERDGETGLDYFGARYFSGAQGRFTTPDPLMASARVF
jgi:RHS repeat-associated protein